MQSTTSLSVIPPVSLHHQNGLSQTRKAKPRPNNILRYVELIIADTFDPHQRWQLINYYTDPSRNTSAIFAWPFSDQARGPRDALEGNKSPGSQPYLTLTPALNALSWRARLN